ncbi:MAG: methyltransferase domain-containing protein [Acidobacteriia bacterium]|nr:methyltransferase domain-containing protein [Terriglobia bacterium]
MRRVVTPELLDTDSGTPAEIAGSLADLRLINRWFGGAATTCSMIELVARKLQASALSFLEVAAGSGDVPEFVRRHLQKRGVQLQTTLLDRAHSHLTNGKQAVVGDALALPFGDGSFDLVGCGLFAHHLSPEQLKDFVSEALRVCRVAVLINDLVRHPLHVALVYAGYPLYRSRLTRHDGPASVRAAYTPHEMQTLLQQTKAARVEIQRHYLFRMGAIAWKVERLRGV